MADSSLCTIDGCDKDRYALGWCTKHYQSLRKKPACTVGGCDKRQSENGLCAMHARRLRVHGSINGGKNYGEVGRFYQDIVLAYDGDDCLFWPFARGRDGRYGHMRHKGSVVLVHRHLCEEVYGQPPTPSHEAAHSCGNGHLGCVAKQHLSWKTHAENMAEMVEHGTSPRGNRSGKAKLTEYQVRRFKSLKGKMRYVDMAEEAGVAYSTIAAMFAGNTWAWIE